MEQWVYEKSEELRLTGRAELLPPAPVGREEIRELLTTELRAVLSDLRQKQMERYYTIKERCQMLGWMSVTPKQQDRIRHLVLVKLRRRGYPQPDGEGLAPGSELLFPVSQCHVVDEAIVQVWEEVRFNEHDGMFEELTA